MRLSTTRLKAETGSIMLLSAVAIPVFLLLGALVLDVGNWYTHKRALQNRADAGALAAGVEYSTPAGNCFANPAGAATAIVAKARQYAGATAPGDYNLGVNNQADVTVAVNSSGVTPCKPQPGDSISAAGWIGTDVIVQESNIGTLGRTFGMNLPSITARARVELNEADETDGFVPLAFPEQSIAKARIRFVNDCNGAELASSVLKPLDSGSQTVSGETLWGPDPSGSAATVAPGQVTFTLPLTVPVPGIGGCGDSDRDYTPVRVELRLAGRPDINLSDAVSCATLQAAASADCYPSISQIRTYNPDGQLIGDRPQIGGVSLTPSGTEPCLADPYYARTTAPSGCTFDARAYIDWGSRPDGPGTTFSATIQVGNGASRTLTGPTPSGPWDAFGIPVAELGPEAVRISWKYELRKGGWAPGGLSNCTNSDPCVQSGTITVHQANLGDDPTGVQESPSDIVGMVKLTRFSSVTSDEVHQGHVNTVLSPYVTVGLRTEFKPGDWSTLRLSEGGRTFSAVCDPYWTQPSTGDVAAAFYFGCQPPYAANDTTADSFWWSTAGQSCPAASAYLASPSGSWPNQTYGNAPWRCLELDPGGTAQATADGIALATGNCATKMVAPQPGTGATATCESSSYTCRNDATYFGTGPPPTLSDPRLVKVFVVPWNAYKGVKAGTTQVVPVLRLAAFYITAWKFGTSFGTSVDPCGATNPKVLADIAKLGAGGKVGGYFVKAVDPAAFGTSTKPCTADDVSLCEVTLTR